MTVEYRIYPCGVRDIRALAANLREQDRDEIVGLGLVPRHALFQCWRGSLTARAAEILTEDGWRIVAAWGENGPMIDPVGYAWLFTTPDIERMPLSFFRETRAEVREMFKTRSRVISSVRADYRQALRFFRLVGFTVCDAVAAPPYGILYHPIEIAR